MSDAKIVYRFRAVSRIQNKWLRRLALVLTFPLMVALNILFAVGAGITLLVAHGYVSNAGLLSSARKRWNVPLGDEDGCGACRLKDESPAADLDDADEASWARRVADDGIRALALEHGFTLRDQGDGRMDLNPYVFSFARALIAKTNAAASRSLTAMAERSNAWRHDAEQAQADVVQLREARNPRWGSPP